MGAYVERLNAVWETVRGELITWVKHAAHCLMQASSIAKGSVDFWYNALGDVVSFLACFHKTSSKRMRGLWCKSGKCFFWHRRVEAIFHE